MSQIKTFYNKLSVNDILVEITPKTETRPPQDIVCVVDVSGSMSTLTELKTDEGFENNGLSILDVVKHSLNTIVSSLQPKDKFSVITFSNYAYINIPLNFVKDKDELKNKITSIKSGGQTNIWAGLMLGMEEIRKNPSGLRNKSIILLTDGLPNINPPSGEEETFKKYLLLNPSLKNNFTLHTCGFGYYLNSIMLSNLANIGSGSYSFIPDIGMVGTIFINLLSNIFNINSTHLQITLPYPSNYFKNIDYNYEEDKGSTTIYLKNLQNDKPRYIYLETVSQLKELKFSYQENNIYLGKLQQDYECDHTGIIDENIYNEQKGRSQYINDLKTSLNLNQFKFNKLDTNNTYLDNLQKDINGQITQAFSREDWMKRWGKHYLLSLQMAHENEWCNNFKDPGVQNYSSKQFQKYQNEIENIFITLAPPTPSYQPTTKISTMNTYYDSGGACYHMDCLVTMNDGENKKVKDIIKGDKVKTSKGFATVSAVVKSEMFKNVKMVKFESGLLITPYHPIRLDNKWVFPLNNEIPVTEIYNDYIYSFVLSKDHSCFVNGIETVTLGHNFTDKNIYHPFFGSQMVINELMKFKGWTEGKVVLPYNSFERHSETGDVYGIKKQ